MAVPAIYLANAAITAAISGGAVAYWLVSARRSVGRPVERGSRGGRPDHPPGRTRSRDPPEGGGARGARAGARARRKAERQARDRQQEIVGLEQSLADKTRALADRLAATDRLEQELRGREQAARDRAGGRGRRRHAREQLLGTPARASARRRPERRRGPGTAPSASSRRTCGGRGEPRQASRDRGPRDGGSPRAADHRRRHPAQRRRARHRDHRLCRRPPER